MNAVLVLPPTRSDALAQTGAPVRLDSGAMRFRAVLARPGVQSYPHGRELVPASVLADPEFIASLAGVPVIIGMVRGPDGVMIHDAGVSIGDPTYTEVRAGTILWASWDDTAQELVGEVVIDTAEGLAAIDGGQTGLSLNYVPKTRPATDADGDGLATVQTGRSRPNHVTLALPRQVRSQGAGLRADADGGSMDPEQIKALASAIVDEMMARKAAAEAAEAEKLAAGAEGADAADPAAKEAADKAAAAEAAMRADAALTAGMSAADAAELVSIHRALGIQSRADASLADCARNVGDAMKLPSTMTASDIIAAYRSVSGAAKRADAGRDVWSAPDRRADGAGDNNPSNLFV